MREKVLLICRERTTFVMLELAKKLLKKNKEVGLFFVSSYESYYEKCNHNKYTYYEAQKLDISIFDLKEITEIFYKKIKKNNYKLDYEFLNRIEKELLENNLNLRVSFLSEQNLCKEYHNRFQNNEVKNEELLLWSELIFKNVDKIMKEYNPTVIYDLENVTLTRIAIFNYCYQNKIPYISIDYPRYNNYLIPSFNLGIKNDNYLEKIYLDIDDNLESEIKEIKNYRNKKYILPEKFKGTITDYKLNLKQSIKIILSSILREINIEKNNFAKKNFRLNLPLFENPIKKVLFHIKYEIKKFISWNNYHFMFEKPVKGEKYIDYPLHLIPESTTFVKAPFYIDELAIIKNISKALPYEWKIYVKEHQAMSGERNFRFYKELKKLKNVRLIELNYYTDPKELIENSLGIITVAGSTAFEGNLLNKPTIVFGNIPYTVIPEIKKVKSFDNLIKEIKKFEIYSTSDINTARYIKLLKIVGEEVELNNLIKELERKYIKNKATSENCEIELEKLYKLYKKGEKLYEIYGNR